METGGIMSFTRPPRRSRYAKVHLSPKESAILRVADAYGFSEIGAAKLILRLRERQKIAEAKMKNQ
ncbi:MAG TPA: hypothetical protein DDZ80_30165 [Cyanobacteria bacterium UBA8803]|nr:hypothetical protein [Cyanobacteria bacterium UBA9273]HBL62499.1 hypothetical protein [Cyanobacteria bacterium UBA8803]